VHVFTTAVFHACVRLPSCLRHKRVLRTLCAQQLRAEHSDPEKLQQAAAALANPAAHANRQKEMQDVLEAMRQVCATWRALTVDIQLACSTSLRQHNASCDAHWHIAGAFRSRPHESGSHAAHRHRCNGHRPARCAAATERARETHRQCKRWLLSTLHLQLCRVSLQ
jgi:hypothetical protein